MEFRTAFTDVREGWVREFCSGRTHMCGVVLFLRILPKVELSLFPVHHKMHTPLAKMYLFQDR